MVLVNAVAIAEHLSKAEQLTSEVSVLLAKGVPDKKIARHVAEAHLTDSLTTRLTDDLSKKYEVGPYTMFALEMQVQASLFLMPPTDMIPSAPHPNEQETSMMTDRLKQYVDNSMVSWKKFVAKTTKTHFTNQKNGYSSPPKKIWYPGGHYPFQKRELESVNTPIGHFRYLEHASFRWHDWDFCDDHKIAVMEFTESPDSPFQKAARQMRLTEAPMQHGLVSFFPEDGTVCRLVVTGSYDHSNAGYTGSGKSTAVTTFGPAEIDGHSYWFPTETVIMTGSEKTGFWARDIIVATEYHKVDAQSTFSPATIQ